MIINFLGHLHPVFAHLPIGFLAIAYVIQYFLKSSKEKSRVIDFVLAAGIVSSLWAAFFGWMLSLSGGYEENLLDWHRYTAIAVCIVSIALLGYKRYKKEEYSTPFYHAGFHLMMLALLLIIGGVIGAQIGARVGVRLQAEQLRILLALLVLAVAVKIGFDLLLTPAELYSVTRVAT